MSNHSFRRLFLVVVLLLATGSPFSQPALVRADVWNFARFFTGGGRSRIVQICVVLMCLALFIMMKKLNG